VGQFGGGTAGPELSLPLLRRVAALQERQGKTTGEQQKNRPLREPRAVLRFISHSSVILLLREYPHAENGCHCAPG